MYLKLPRPTPIGWSNIILAAPAQISALEYAKMSAEENRSLTGLGNTSRAAATSNTDNTASRLDRTHKTRKNPAQSDTRAPLEPVMIMAAASRTAKETAAAFLAAPAASLCLKTTTERAISSAGA